MAKLRDEVQGLKAMLQSYEQFCEKMSGKASDKRHFQAQLELIDMWAESKDTGATVDAIATKRDNVENIATCDCGDCEICGYK